MRTKIFLNYILILAILQTAVPELAGCFNPFTLVVLFGVKAWYFCYGKCSLAAWLCQILWLV